jgi:2-polyprenyl-3-methyl-5-hydroxy-6-metoxy-1,4-benzoquinol methylase
MSVGQDETGEAKMTDSNHKTREPQYQVLFDVERVHGRSHLGLMTNQSYNEDPKRLLFTLARYKFVASMLRGAESVLEIGCADAFGTRLVQQTVNQVTASDFDLVFVDDARSRVNPNWPLNLIVHDLLQGPVQGGFDAAFCLDVLEHISASEEDQFLRNFVASLRPERSVAIIGMPSLESQAFASQQSREGHVNCKSGDELEAFLSKYFQYVFIFSMNDEVVHTGFRPMAHYLLALCCEPRRHGDG